MKHRCFSRRRRLMAETLETRAMLAGDFSFVNPLGSTGDDLARGLAVDTQGNSYVTGELRNTLDFDPGPGEWKLSPLGAIDAFVAKYSPQGELVWAHRFGGSGLDWGTGIAVDLNGNVCIVGRYSASVDFDPSNGVANQTAVGAAGGFVLQLDSEGSYAWAGSLDSFDGETLTAVATDGDGNLFITGRYNGSGDFDPGSQSFTLTSRKNGSTSTFDAFLTKLNSSGELVWAKSWGGNALSFNGDGANDVAIDSLGNAYVTGVFLGAADLDPGSADLSVTAVGTDDVYVSKFDLGGNLTWARVLYGGTNFANSIIVDEQGDVVIAGGLQSTTDFDPGPAVVNLAAPSGGIDAFAWKLDTNGNYQWAMKLGGNGSSNEALSVDVDGQGDIYLSGQFAGANADFDPGASAFLLSSRGSVDAFVARLNPDGQFVSARQFGGTSVDRGQLIAVHSAMGEVYLAGQFQGTADFDPSAASHELTSLGGADAFLLKLTQNEISGHVWLDANANGIRDLDEIVLDDIGVDIVLTLDAILGNADDRTLGQLKTENGSYRFMTPHAGNYYVRFEKPASGLHRPVFAPSDIGADLFDSDALGDGRTRVLIQIAGEPLRNVDAGFIEVMTNDWHKASAPTDVDGEFGVSPLDAVLVINELNAAGVRPLQFPRPGGREFPPYWDVNDDLFLSPLDALLVIIHLNSGGDGEVVSDQSQLPSDEPIQGLTEADFAAWWDANSTSNRKRGNPFKASE